MRKKYKKMFHIFVFIILLFVMMLLAVYINHRIHLNKEQELLAPLGEMGVPSVPMYLFVSNGSGTGFDEETWRQAQKKYIEKLEDAKIMELNCPHYVQDYEYTMIAEEMKLYLSDK